MMDKVSTPYPLLLFGAARVGPSPFGFGFRGAAGPRSRAGRTKLGPVSVAIIGGTGDEGFGLALRLARAGEDVVIGSRAEERGQAAAEKAADLLGLGSGAGT